MAGDADNCLSLRVDAAIAEYLESAERGAPVDRDAFLARHADIAEELRDFLGDYSAVKRDAPRPVNAVDAPAKENEIINTSCPNGHALRIAGKLAGRRAKCPKCESPFIVPNFGRPSSDPPQTLNENAAPVRETLSLKSAGADDTGTNRPSAQLRTAGPLPKVGQRFGQFELLELIGQGGFGAVYRARNPQLDRDVALKLPRPGMLGDPEEIARFLREAQTAAQLHHPSIVTVYDAGQINGVYYIASAYIPGKSLRQHLSELNPNSESNRANQAEEMRYSFSPREAATLISKLATALNYAHQKGIFHRDVKPENIMLDENGDPHLMDFGLARRMEGDTLRTMEGIKMGTPAYMSPEQAKGESHLADARSDLWSLGVILYELLTGRLPFESKKLEVLLTDIIQGAVEAPRKLDASIPRDLETICVKCLAKVPVRRYPTCQHLADELERWLAGRPITARPIGVLERNWLWAKRRPAVAALSGILLAVIAGIVVVAPIAAIHESLLRQNAEESSTKQQETLTQLNATLQQRDDAIKAREQEIKEKKLLLEARDAAIASNIQTIQQRDKALDEKNDALRKLEENYAELQQSQKERDEAEADKQEALDRVDELNEPLQDRLARALLKRAALRYQSAQIFDAIALAGVAYRTVPKGRPLHDSARTLIAGWSTQIGQPMLLQGPVYSAEFSPDGNTVITGSADKRVVLWDTATRVELPGVQNRRLLGDAVRAATFCPDGSGCIAATLRGEIVLLTSQQENNSFNAGKLPIYTAAFNPDGSEFVVACDGGWARKWNIQSNQSLDFRHQGKVFGATFSPDGKFVLTCSADGTAQLWDAAIGTAVGKPIVHPKDVSAVAFHPDGRSFLTGCYDGVVRQWSVKTGTLLGIPMPHKARILAVNFSPLDGHTIITGCDDGTAWLWDSKTHRTLADPLRHGGPVYAAAFSPNGRTLVTASQDHTARLWPFPIVHSLAETALLGDTVQAMAFSNNAKFVAAAGDDNGISIWDASTSKLVGKLAGHDKTVNAVAFSADGGKVLTASDDLTARLWDTKTQQPLCEPLQTDAPVKTIAISSDGTAVLTSGLDGSAQIWDASTGKRVATLSGHKQMIRDAAFSSDDKTVLTGSTDGTARLWDASTGQPLYQPIKHVARVLAVALSPDGHTVLTGCSDRSALLWNAETGKAVSEPLRHGDNVVAVKFSPDGRIVVTGGSDGRVCWWDAATGCPVADSVRHNAPISDLAFRSDGQSLMVASTDGMMCRWKVPQPMPDNQKMIDAWILVHTRNRLDDQGLPIPWDLNRDLKAAEETLKAIAGNFQP